MEETTISLHAVLRRSTLALKPNVAPADLLKRAYTGISTVSGGDFVCLREVPSAGEIMTLEAIGPVYTTDRNGYSNLAGWNSSEMGTSTIKPTVYSLWVMAAAVQMVIPSSLASGGALSCDPAWGSCATSTSGYSYPTATTSAIAGSGGPKFHLWHLSFAGSVVVLVTIIIGSLLACCCLCGMASCSDDDDNTRLLDNQCTHKSTNGCTRTGLLCCQCSAPQRWEYCLGCSRRLHRGPTSIVTSTQPGPPALAPYISSDSCKCRD
jgi:hypothetical protein